MNCITYTGADCDTDHHLLMATVEITMAKVEKQDRTPPLNLEDLKYDKASYIAAEVSNRFGVLYALNVEKTPGELWKVQKQSS